MPKWFSSPVVLAFALGLAGIAGMRLFGTFELYYRLSGEREKLQRELAYLEAENARVRQELRLSGTPEAVERDAKERLNLKKGGEEVIVVVPAEVPATGTPKAARPWSHFGALIRSLMWWRQTGE